MNNPFKIDFRKWVLLLIPTMLRKPVVYHFIYVVILPIVSVYRSFYIRRMNNNFYARYDSSYGNIQRMLNLMFPSEVGNIVVKPSVTSEVLYDKVYVTDSHTAPHSAFVGQSYIDKSVTQKLFDVVLPSDLQSQKQQIANLVGRYSLPGYGFNIY